MSNGKRGHHENCPKLKKALKNQHLNLEKPPSRRSWLPNLWNENISRLFESDFGNGLKRINSKRKTNCHEKQMADA